MSLHFSANQYEESYRPWRLGAWEVSRSFPERPRIRKGRTKIIANDRGHLLKAPPRNSVSPWGPLTQQLDLNANHEEKDAKKFEIPKENNPKDESVPKKELDNSRENQTARENEKDRRNSLKVTGAGLATLSPRSPKPETESKSTSGTVTPASFRKASKNVTPFVRSPAAVSSRSRSSASSSKNGPESNSSASNQEGKERIIEEASTLPADTIEDALLPRKPEDVLDGASRALAIRLVEHPGATNCTKYTILRPYTAPSPVPETPLLAKRPKTSKNIRKISEIEYALKWDLKDRIGKNETIIDVKQLNKNTKKGKAKDPQTPRSIASTNSEDSGINIPKRAWEENGPDTNELTSKLECLKKSQEANQFCTRNKNYHEQESGYGTPASSMTKASLPSVKSENTSGRNSRHAVGHNISRSVSNLSRHSNSKQTEKISIDSKCLSAKANNSENRPTSNISKSSSNSHHSSGNEAKSRSQNSPRDQRSSRPPPPQRDPLEIMETLDSVFHRVPLRDTTGGFSYPSARETKEKLMTIGTQTELKNDTLDQSATSHGEQIKKQELTNQIRSRNCVACEVRAQDEPPKKYGSGNDIRQPFRFGKPDKKYPNKPRYVRQSEKYQAKLKPHRDGPRYWPINTLSSPFSNRQGYGQDQYPNHMRLRTTYQMAHHKNEKSQYTPLIRKLYK